MVHSSRRAFRNVAPWDTDHLFGILTSCDTCEGVGLRDGFQSSGSNFSLKNSQLCIAYRVKHILKSVRRKVNQFSPVYFSYPGVSTASFTSLCGEKAEIPAGLRISESKVRAPFSGRLRLVVNIPPEEADLAPTSIRLLPTFGSNL